MNKLTKNIKKMIERFKGMSKSKKIAIGIIVAGIILASTIYATTVGKIKYSPLFTNLDPKDSKVIVDKLDEKKVKYKVDNNTILVPDDQVGQLRLQMAGNITNGSVGFELFDQDSKFGMNDSEFKVKYQRALQGELERTIKTFPEINNCKVNIVMPEDSAFVKNSTQASASVTLMLKPGEKLNQNQVKGIVSLISSSVKNLPKNNIQIVDDKMELLTDGLYDDTGNNGNSQGKQFDEKVKYEKYFEKKVLNQLEPIYGKEKVKVKINTELDFDAYKKTTDTKDKQPPVVSEKKVKDVNNSSNNEATSSPIDNNMTNTIKKNDNKGNESTHEETTTNYDSSGNVKEELIQAPGKVKRITASVIIDDSNISEEQKQAITDQVNGIIGQPKENQDNTVVEGVDFDKTADKLAKKDLLDMKKAEEKAKLMAMYRNITCGIIALIVAIIVAVVIKKSRKTESEDLETDNTKGLDVVIDDVLPKEKQKYEPIDFEKEDEKSHLEKEIKKYASDKPDQVVEIIKSWIANDER